MITENASLRILFLIWPLLGRGFPLGFFSKVRTWTVVAIVEVNSFEFEQRVRRWKLRNGNRRGVVLALRGDGGKGGGRARVYMRSWAPLLSRLDKLASKFRLF